MNSIELANCSIKELKSICVAQSIPVIGDKRSRQTWIDAIENYQHSQTLSQTLVNDPSNAVNNHIPQPEKMVDLPDLEELTDSRKIIGAHIVLITLAAILYAVCIVPIGMGIVIYRAISWGRDRFTNQTLAFGNPRRAESIDYFPSPA